MNAINTAMAAGIMDPVYLIIQDVATGTGNMVDANLAEGINDALKIDPITGEVIAQTV